MYRLVFMTGPHKGRRVAVRQGPLLIGRDHDVQLDLRDDDEVSRHHALIEPQPDGYLLKDLGARNPVLVNGQAVRGAIKLRHNDQIEIGRTLMQFHLLEPQTAAGSRRTSGPLQAVTFTLMALFLTAQVAYWIIFPLFHRQPLAEPAPRTKQAPATPQKSAAEPAAAAPAAEPSPKRDRLLEELARADRKAKADERAPDLPPPPLDIASQLVAQVRGVVTDRPPAEVAVLQEAVADLRQQVKNLADAATNGLEAVSPPAPPSAAEVVLARAKDMIAAALVQEQRGNLSEADAQLERVQAMLPAFVPAYVERARLYEKRGMLKKAGEQWTQVLNRSEGTALYDQAAAERQRLARAEVTITVARPDPRSAAPEQASLPRTIRVAAIEREKFEAGPDFEEMRVVRVQLRPRPSEGDLDVDDVRVVVSFYDRDEKTGRLHLTRCVAPKEPLVVDGLWRAGEQKSVTAAYMVAPTFRAEEQRKHGARSRYEGVRVRVYYKGQLQDEEAVPRELIRQPAPPGPAAPPAPAPARPAAADDPNAPMTL